MDKTGGTMVAEKAIGPTYAEMRDPSRLPEAVKKRAQKARKDPLDAGNLFNIGWTGTDGRVAHLLVPPALTGVKAPIALLRGDSFPTGSHKVGAAYSILAEMRLAGTLAPGNVAVFPSTGNFGIGGSWVGPRAGHRAIVILPENMSRERYAKIEAYGAECVKTPGSEANVKEIYDRTKEVGSRPGHVILNQFAEFGNYRFHYGVTGEACLSLARDLAQRGIGSGRVAAFVSAMGSGGTIAAGDRVKQASGAAVVGVEPVQCSTLYNAGYGTHAIEGIGDKHVTWIHHVRNMDLLVCVDDRDCLLGLQAIERRADALAERTGADAAALAALQGHLGVSGVCNLLAAAQTARHLGLGPQDLVITVATDGFDRYGSVLQRVDREDPADDRALASRAAIFREPRRCPVLDGTPDVRRRWHNQKYFTWVEQQGKSVRDLDQQWDEGFWQAEQARADEIDRQILAARG